MIASCDAIAFGRSQRPRDARRAARGRPDGRRRRAFLEDLFAKAVAAAHPATCLPPHLPAPPRNGRLILLAAGKAAGSMIEVAEQHYLDTLRFPASRMSGIAVARHGYGRPTRVIPMVEAGHPIPDEAGLESAATALELAEGATRGRSRAGADVGRRVGQLDRAGRDHACREAGGDARAAALRREHRRDQHGAQASLAHQGRAARARRRIRRASSRSRSPTCRATIRR